MTERPRPMNQAARAATSPELPSYPEPLLGNPAATLMESGVGNCFPGLEFDLRQLDVRFFPGLVFSFPGVTPEGPDGTQGAQLVYAETDSDPIFQLPHPWLARLKTKLNGPDGAALGSGTWYLHWVEQYGRRIELYDVTLWQNLATKTPYEGEIAWWIIRLIELDPDPEVADLTIALTQRDADGQPAGNPVVLEGKRRAYLDGEGMIPEVYRAGELTASMCSPWTHDFRDCACQYWASNHPDVALGEVADPNTASKNQSEKDKEAQHGSDGDAEADNGNGAEPAKADEHHEHKHDDMQPPDAGPPLADRTSAEDPAQAVTFLDWMRRRTSPHRDISAAPTIELARPGRYDPYEINLHWEELSFVLQGQEAEATPGPFEMLGLTKPKKSTEEIIEDLSKNLARLEFTLSMEYLYAYFSLRAPEDVTPEEAANWPGLANDLRAARQLILSVAISEMTHLRWVNQTLWILCFVAPEKTGPYKPVVATAETVPFPDGTEIDLSEEDMKELGLKEKSKDEWVRDRKLQPATQKVLQIFVEVERPGGQVDTEYASLVEHLRKGSDKYPVGLHQLAVRIDSDGLNHYQKFRDIKRILAPYTEHEAVYLRPVTEAAPDDPDVQEVLDQLDFIVASLRRGYASEAASIQSDKGSNMERAAAEAEILAAREAMHKLHDLANALARDKHKGVPFFARAASYDAEAWSFTAPPDA